MREYLTNCSYIRERTADYKTAEKMCSLFEFTTEISDGCGNLCSDLEIDVKTKKAKFKKKRDHLAEDKTSLYGAIPSALLMYRLACLFKGTAETYGRDGYKFTWQFRLKHKKSGRFITFGEWKGGSLFWSEVGSLYSASTDKAFLRDVEKLVTYLISDNAAHPYDGVVAGSVA